MNSSVRVPSFVWKDLQITPPALGDELSGPEVGVRSFVSWK
jgi:hypothetical protein